MSKSRAQARYDRMIQIACTVYAVSLFGGSVWLRHNAGNTDILTYVFALLPGLAVLAVFAAIGRYLIEESDEYLRALRVRQSLVATGIALAACTIWGSLESFGLAPHLICYWVAIFWLLGYALGAGINLVLARSWKTI